MKQTSKNFTKDFKNKTVLITGHTGFKGSWLALWLVKLGAKVYGVSKSIPTNPSLFEITDLKNHLVDIRENIKNFSKVSKIINDIKPDFVFHLAAQSLVRTAYEDPIETWETNVMGSVNVLESLTTLNKKCACVMVTSDKCYDNVEWYWGYKETDKIGGKDPYSASKGSAEIAIRSYNESFFNKNNFINVASVRAGNVIGGGDWALDRIVPDCINSWRNKKEIILRNPFATRPWQHVLEPLSGYLSTAKNLYDENLVRGESFNFGPKADQDYSVEELVAELSKFWNDAKWKIEKMQDQPHEAGLLKLNCDKALAVLNWLPTLNFSQTVKFTANWYKQFEVTDNLFNYTLEQIDNYVSLSKEANND
jgi:CDP-glucose 4,6-dehydratase